MGEGKGIASERTKEQKIVLQSVQPNGQKPILLPISYSVKSCSSEFMFKDHEFSGFMVLCFETILNAAPDSQPAVTCFSESPFCCKFASSNFCSQLKYKLVSFHCNL